MLRVAGSESARDEADGRSVLDEIAREGARRMLVAALETEVAAYLEAHGDERDDAGHALVVRNGKGRTRKITLGAGTIPLSAPRVNDRRTDQNGERRRFTSRILPPYMRRSPKVAEGLPVLYLRGLSTGDFREALAALLGDDAVGLSATNIARLTNEWETEYSAFQKRSLADRDYVYVWVDGVHFNIRLEDDRLCTLVMIGALADGTKELIAVADGYRESAESWKMVLRDLESEVYGLWARGDLGLRSMLLITHLIEEAVFLGDRIVIMGTNPGSVRETIPNPLPHPREYRDPAFLALVDQIHAAITQIHLPDERRQLPDARARLEPFPDAQVAEVFGLLEVLHDQGGAANLFALGDRFRIEIGRVILIVKAAELFELVDTPKQEVRLTPIGRELVAGDANARKRIIHTRLLAIPTFRYLVDKLRLAPEMRLSADIVEEELAMYVPAEPTEGLFETIVRWGRYGELLGYDPETREVYLDLESTVAPALGTPA